MKPKYLLNKKEVVVVFGCIFLLMLNLGAVSYTSNEQAKRIICRSNLKSLGTAMMVFANDNNEQYPDQSRRGGVRHNWSDRTDNWHLSDKDWSREGNLTVSASLFLLVREADVDPKSFVCKGSDQKPFTEVPPGYDLLELWDFGSPTYPSRAAPTGPQVCVSYAFQNTFQVAAALPAYPADPTSPAGMALMADRNPYWDEDADKTIIPNEDNYLSVAVLLSAADIPETVLRWRVKVANSFAHNREGQNVLYNDGHAEFKERPDVGVENDNIYTCYSGGAVGPWTEIQRRQGGPRWPSPTSGTIRNSRDSYLVNDPTW